MKLSLKMAIGVAASLGLGAAAVLAQPGPMGAGMGAHKGGMQHGGMAMHGQGGTGHGPTGSGLAGPAAVHQLLTPEERTALQEKMHTAKTPEERRTIAEATRSEVQKRAREKGITLPEPHGPGAGFGPSFGHASK